MSINVEKVKNNKFKVAIAVNEHTAWGGWLLIPFLGIKYVWDKRSQVLSEMKIDAISKQSRYFSQFMHE